MLEEGIKKKEKEINETEKKINDYQNSAKETLKKGDKIGAKNILTRKKKLVEKMNEFQGTLILMEEQKMLLDNSEILRDAFNQVTIAEKIAQNSLKDIDLENMKEEFNEEIEKEQKDEKESDNENNDSKETKQEESNLLQESIIANIFSYKDINPETLKTISKESEKIQQKNIKITNYLNKLLEQNQKECDEELGQLENEFKEKSDKKEAEED